MIHVILTSTTYHMTAPAAPGGDTTAQRPDRDVADGGLQLGDLTEKSITFWPKMRQKP